MAAERTDWAAVLDRLLEGDELACLQVSRLITGFLAGWRAYDFQQEWQDLVQEVLLAVITGAKQGRIRDRAATVGYIRTIAHHKYADRLKRHIGKKEDETLEWEEATETIPGALPAHPARDEVVVGIRLSLERLPEKKRQIVYGVYGEGKTYEQVAEETGTPLGTVKRFLRDGMVELRAQYAAVAEIK